jgi:hypothetical protein
VPDDRIEQTEADKMTGQAWVKDRGGHGLACQGPFEVIADVGEDKHLKMSRAFYDEIEVVEPR